MMIIQIVNGLENQQFYFTDMPKGEKTKKLWTQKKYRDHMSSVHLGQKAWNKTSVFILCQTCNKKFKIYPCRKGKVKFCSKLCYAKSLSKGENVGYSGLHKWVQKKLGKANKCEFDNSHFGKFEWANKSHKYKRKLTDWIQLCNLCHQKYDSKTKKVWKSIIPFKQA